MENRIKFTKEQLQIAITDHLNEEKGVNELFTMVVNGLMYSERTEFLMGEETGINKGNGYRKLLKAGIGSGLELQVPRDRLGQFRPILLGVLEQQEERIKDLSFALYGNGLTTQQISKILTDIYGNNYSKSGISRINVEFSAVVDSWLNRPLDKYYPLIFIDAIHVRVRRDVVGTEAFYVVLGVKEDFTREVLAIINFPTESASGWLDTLQGLKQRGIEQVGLFIFDDLKGLDQSIGMAFSTAKQQKCILHFQRNLSKNIRVKDRKEFCQQVSDVFNPDDRYYTKEQAETNLKETLADWVKKYPSLQHSINRQDLSLLFTYLEFDYRVRRMIYTTNWIERLNKSFRRTLKIRNALPKVESAFTLMGFVAMDMEEKTYKYPITNFKFESYFNKKS